MPQSKFQSVANQLRKRVLRGYYNASQKLPSEYVLAQEFGVSRLTLRKAIDQLIADQVLVKNPGKGTYIIQGQDKVESGRMGLQSFTEVARAFGKTSHTEVISCRVLSTLDTESASALRLPLDAANAAVELVRRRFWDDDPMTVEHIVLRREFLEGMTEADLAGSLFAALERNVRVGYSQQTVEALLVPPELSHLLQVATGAPLLKVSAVTYTADSQPLLYDRSYYRADKYKVKTTLSR